MHTTCTHRQQLHSAGIHDYAPAGSAGVHANETERRQETPPIKWTRLKYEPCIVTHCEQPVAVCHQLAQFH